MNGWLHKPILHSLLVAAFFSFLVFTQDLQSAIRNPQSGDWPNVGNDRGGMRYSTLTQINRDNVKNLQVAWTYRTGELDPSKKTTIECTPLVIDGVMYITTIHSRVVALDAATGKEIWKFDPYAKGRHPIIASGGVNRGVAFWTDGKERRVLLGAGDEIGRASCRERV